MLTKVTLTKVEIMELFNALSRLNQDKKIKLPFKFSYASIRTVRALKEAVLAIDATTNEILKDLNKDQNPLLEEVKKKEAGIKTSEIPPLEKQSKLLKLGEEYEPKFKGLATKHKKAIDAQNEFAEQTEAIEVFLYQVESNELDVIPNYLRKNLIPMIRFQEGNSDSDGDHK